MCKLKTEKPQVQQRVKKIIAPCDKLSQIVFECSAEEYADIIDNHRRCGCVEGYKKGNKVSTKYWLELVEDYKDKLPLDAFHREVLFHAMSLYEQGFEYFTISMAFDSLTGGEEKRHVYKEQYAEIKAAINKLGFTRIEIDLTDLLKAFPKYAANSKRKRKDNPDDRARIVGCLLPMKYVETEINGQKALIVKVLDESPLMTYAKLKNQILTYDATPLAISGQHNTPQVITIKNYLLRRIELIKQRNLNSSILFETLYKNCGLADAAKNIKQNARREIADILNSFKANGVIQNFEFERQGTAYRSIKIML